MRRRINLKLREFADRWKESDDTDEKRQICREVLVYAKLEVPLQIGKLIAYQI